VNDKLLVAEEFLFENNRSLVWKLAYFIFCEVMSLVMAISIYLFMDYATNGGFAWFFGYTMELLSPDGTLARVWQLFI
jgi:hypothetical protein